MTNCIYDKGGFALSKLGWRSDVPRPPRLTKSELTTRVGETENCVHNIRAMRYINNTDFETGTGSSVEFAIRDDQLLDGNERDASMIPASDIVSKVRYSDDDVLHPIMAYR